MLGGGDEGDLAGQLAMVASFSAQLNQAAALPAEQLVGSSGGEAFHKTQRRQHQRVEEERETQWSHQETRDLIVVRAEMEGDITAATPPRSEAIWEAAAIRMTDRGHRRTPDQCRRMWNSLVDRYKGKGTAELGVDNQSQFFEELQAVFAMQAKNMKGQLEVSESGETRAMRKLKRLIGERSSDEFSVDDNCDGDKVNEEHQLKMRKKKADSRRMHQQQGTNVISNNIHDVIQSFLHQQKQFELQWQETMERRTQERRLFEWEWRQSMEKLERERLMLEQAWREMEEQRRMREESRADRRDALLTALLSKLIEEDI